MKKEHSLKETFEQFNVEFTELKVPGSVVQPDALELDSSACNVAQALRQDTADAGRHGRALA